VPVVVGPEELDGHVEVVAGGEQLPGEARQAREVERAEHAVDVHVPDALVDVVATGPHLGEGQRVDAVLLGHPAGYGVEADVGQRRALEHPHLAPVVHRLDARRPLGGAARQAPLEQVGRLDHVVVDAHQDQIVDLHAPSLPPEVRYDIAVRQ
jgi:hypothetical protein